MIMPVGDLLSSVSIYYYFYLSDIKNGLLIVGYFSDPSDIMEASSSSLMQSMSEIIAEWDIPDSSPTNGYIPFSTIPHSKSATLHKTANGTEFVCLNPSKGSKIEEQTVDNHSLSSMKKSTSTNTSLASNSANGSLWSSKFSPFHNSLSLQSFSSLNIFSSRDTM